MSEKITPKQLAEIGIETGTYQLSATALSEGLLESDYSNEETYVRSEALIYEISPTEDYYIVTGYNPSELVNVVIPSEYDDGVHGTLPVREIGERAFYQSLIEEVEIPNTIRLINQAAFFMCESLKKVTFGSREGSVIYFRSDWNDIKLYYSVLGAFVTKAVSHIGNGIYKATFSSENPKIYFTGKLNNTEFKTEQFVSWHGSCWYANGATDGDGNYLVDIYQDYTSPELENDYCTIGKTAFMYCSALSEELTITNMIGTIDEAAFAYCWGLKEVYMPFNSGTRIIGKSAFMNCYGLGRFGITNTVEVIKEYAFWNCGKNNNYFYFSSYPTLLTKFANRVKTIERNAFLDCKNLILGEPESVLGGYVYEENIFPKLEVLGECAFKGCVKNSYTAFYKDFKFPKTMKEIGIDVFKGCTALSTVEFENPYGWYFDNDTRVFIDKSMFSDSSWLAQMMISGAGGASGTTSSEPANAFNYPWYKIFQMIAPTISIENNAIMNIKDSTGIAERFKIYARKEGSETRVEVAIVNAVSEADFE